MGKQPDKNLINEVNQMRSLLGSLTSNYGASIHVLLTLVNFHLVDEYAREMKERFGKSDEEILGFSMLVENALSAILEGINKLAPSIEQLRAN